MVNPYSNTKLRIPKGFQSLLVGLSTEVLRNQPRNIPAFAADYFEKLLQRREQGQFNLTDEDSIHHPDANLAATKIQAQFRGHLARRDFEKVKHEHEDADKLDQTSSDDHQLEKERAAVSIQAQFRGYQVRKHLQELTDDHDQQNHHNTFATNVSYEKLQSEENNGNPSRTYFDRDSTQLSEDFERHTQIPRDSNFDREFQEQFLKEYVTDDEDEMNNLPLDQAATRIQASFRGYKTRKELGSVHGHSHEDHEHFNEMHNKNILSPSNQGNQVLAHESEDNEAAAVKIQAAYRGYRVRKELEK